MIISKNELFNIMDGSYHDPHHLLGMHILGDGAGLVVRTWDPGAKEISLLCTESGDSFNMVCINNKGFFELVLPCRLSPFSYRLLSIYDGGEREWVDPYVFLPSINNTELTAFNEGWERRPFDKLGAIPKLHQGTLGVSFVVWAPSAKSVHLLAILITGIITHYQCAHLAVRGVVNCLSPMPKLGINISLEFLGLMVSFAKKRTLLDGDSNHHQEILRSLMIDPFKEVQFFAQNLRTLELCQFPFTKCT